MDVGSEGTKLLNDARSTREETFIERYIAGKMKLGILFGFGDLPQYGLIVRSLESARIGDKVVPSFSTYDTKFRSEEFNGQQSFMLPFDIHVMKREQEIIRSIVRLHRFENISTLRGNAIYEVTPFCPFLSEGVGSFADGKIRISNIRDAIVIEEGSGENVEGTSERIDICAGLDTKLKRKLGVSDGHQKKMGAVRIHISADHIDVELDPILKPLLEVIEV